MAVKQAQRRFAAGSNAVLVSVFAIAAACVGYLLVDLHRVRLDLSADQGSVLLADTRTKLALLDKDGKPVVVTAFSGQRGKKDSYFKDRALEDLLEELDYNSQVVEVHLVDFDKDRLTAEKLGVTDYSTVVVQRGEARVDIKDRELFKRVGKAEERHLEFLGEQAVNRAFSQLMAENKRVVYALIGHGELDPDNHDLGGLSEAVAVLAQDDYELKRLDFVRQRDMEVPRVPDDAAAVAVLRPKLPIPALEEDLLLAYLSGGGSILLAVDPDSPVPGLLGRMGVAIPSGRVLDKLLVFPYPDRPVPRYKSHPITKDLSEDSLVTVLSGIAPVQPSVPPMEGIRSTIVLETGRDGWIDRGGELKNGQALYEPDLDGAGPATMAVALDVSRDSGLVKKGAARVLVVGDADLFTNSLLAEGPGNASFILNSFRWLVGDEDRISVVGRPASKRRLALTAEDGEQIRWLAIGFGPLLVVLLGAAVWATRRGR
ncbi:hypothetical protein LBMAG42_04110 [Deltaproteobacteria bacterium]|nr:hypothetical protein LBMAG42_04110 [Deltaproteobacteria bacterium]